VQRASDQRSRLRHLDLFVGLDDEVLARAVAGLEGVDLEAGECFDVTATRASCCLVAVGRLALGFGCAERERTISLLEEGDLLVRPTAPWAAVGPLLRCVAIEPSSVLLVERQRLDGWMDEPVLAGNLVRLLSAQVAERELAVAIALEPRVERRLLLKLQQLAERFGRVTPEGVRLDLRLTHQELADMVGAVRETVTIALGNLARSGELSITNRTILIRRPPPEDDPGAGA
jgi:CRP/FNR family transcriptional regulator, cyclic AMP receptor protein